MLKSFNVKDSIFTFFLTTKLPRIVVEMKICLKHFQQTSVPKLTKYEWNQSTKSKCETVFRVSLLVLLFSFSGHCTRYIVIYAVHVPSIARGKKSKCDYTPVFSFFRFVFPFIMDSNVSGVRNMAECVCQRGLFVIFVSVACSSLYFFQYWCFVHIKSLSSWMFVTFYAGCLLKFCLCLYPQGSWKLANML